MNYKTISDTWDTHNTHDLGLDYTGLNGFGIPQHTCIGILYLKGKATFEAHFCVLPIASYS